MSGALGCAGSANDVGAPLELALLDSLNALGIEHGAISDVRVHEWRALGCAGERYHPWRPEPLRVSAGQRRSGPTAT
jgi:hypothetical protein